MSYEVFFAGVGGTVFGALIGAWISSLLTFGFQKQLLQQQLEFQRTQGDADALSGSRYTPSNSLSLKSSGTWLTRVSPIYRLACPPPRLRTNAARVDSSLRKTKSPRKVTSDRTTREVILTLADVVHSHARASIRLHDKIERKQNTFVSLIRSFFGLHVEFEQLTQESIHISTTWKRVLSEVESTKQLILGVMSVREREYFELIRRYAETNATAATILAERQAAFSKASKSIRRSTLNYTQCKELTRHYDDTLTKCQELFDELKGASITFLSPSNS